MNYWKHLWWMVFFIICACESRVIKSIGRPLDWDSASGSWTYNSFSDDGSQIPYAVVVSQGGATKWQITKDSLYIENLKIENEGGLRVYFRKGNILHVKEGGEPLKKAFVAKDNTAISNTLYELVKK